MNLPISVIIPTMNRPDSLYRTLIGISRCNSFPSQIIVIDQSSKEETLVENRNVLYSFNSVFCDLLYKFQRVPSLTKARNLGFFYANNDILVFMDDDVDVQTDSFSNISYLFNDNRIALAGGINRKDIGAHPSFLSCLFGLASFTIKNKAYVSHACCGCFPTEYSEMTEAHWAMGFFFAVRKSLMEKWNICFDEKFESYAYAEDLDFTYGYYSHAIREGMMCIMSNLMIVNHNVSREYRVPSKKLTYMSVLHRYYIANKYKFSHYGFWILWSNLGEIVKRVLNRERVADLINVQIFYYFNRHDILSGNFHYLDW